ncbi:EGLN protein, partial [Alectura lathami]|nr:EGLN protein [Alectura lathami]
DPVPAEHCDLRPVTAEPPVTLSYATGTVPWGCVSSSSLHTGHEVHVLSVHWSKVSERDPARHPQAAPGCSGRGLPRPGPGPFPAPSGKCSPLTPGILGLSPGSTAAPGPELPSAVSKGQLLAWAQSTYGGITSYSELRDPREIHLRLGEDAGSPQDCVPREHFNATTHLDAEVFFHGVKGCAHRSAHGARAAHIVQLQPEHSSPITEVNLSLSCPERAVSNLTLILQSQANLTWFLSANNCDVQFLVSGPYKIMSISTMPLIKGPSLPSTEQGLIAKALERNCIIASFSAIPISPRITLEIQEHEVLRKPSLTPTTPAPTPNSLPHALLLTLKPWKCTDDTMEIVIARSHLELIKDVVNITLRDISCQAEKNATHFTLRTPLSHCGTSLEGEGHAKNELILSLSKGSALRSVRVAFQCQIPRELFLRLFPTAAFEAPQTELEVNKEAFVQVPRELQRGPAGGAPRQPGQEGLALPLHLRCPRGQARPLLCHPQVQGWAAGVSLCSPQPSAWQNNTIFEKVLEVTVKDVWRPPNNRGLGLAAVLGITFGAFLIGALLTAGLWYIYSHTRPISKLQPVSTTAPASESSSTNHSIGSTQSTPCSTSSMA